MACYFNLDPVQGWAPDFVQLPFKPFKHGNYSGCWVHGSRFTVRTLFPDKVWWTGLSRHKIASERYIQIVST